MWHAARTRRDGARGEPAAPFRCDRTMSSTRLSLAAALVAAAMLAPLDRAAAQPACAAQTLAAFLAPSFACTIGPWRLAGFDYVGVSLSDEELVADPAHIGVDPFAATDAAGRATFGLAFDGFEASVHRAGAPDGISGSVATNHLSFIVEALRPTARLVGATFDGGAGIAGDDVAARFLSANAGAVVSGLTGNAECGGGSADHAGAVGATIVHVETPCVPGSVDAVRVGLSTFGIFLRDEPGEIAFSGHAGGRVDRITFVVAPTPAPTVATPEPATLGLVAGGLVALGALGRRTRDA